MFGSILRLFGIGCRHRHVSLPFASAATQDYTRHTDWQPVTKANTSAHYVVCLDCGEKFGYDWSQMRVIRN